MDGYLSWDKKTITDFSGKNISAMYERGFVFTRLGLGVMTQTRSARIDLGKFELTSENRRVLRKTENLAIKTTALPHPDYDWRIHKLGFDFYAKKFGPKIFSANKIKELLTSAESNFNLLMEYDYNDGIASASPRNDNKNKPVGYAICFQNSDLLHYAHPFYDLNCKIPNLGIGMMTKAIIWAKKNGKKFVCLGSAQNPSAIYKTQFSGFEWFDGIEWKTDIEKLKAVLQNK